MSFFKVSLTPSLRSMFLNTDLEKRTSMVQHKQIWTGTRVSIFDSTLCTRLEQEVQVAFKLCSFTPNQELLRHPHRQPGKQKTFSQPISSKLNLVETEKEIGKKDFWIQKTVWTKIWLMWTLSDVFCVRFTGNFFQKLLYMIFFVLPKPQTQWLLYRCLVYFKFPNKSP